MWNTLSTARSQENLFKCPFHSSRKNKFECEIHFQLPEVRRIFSNFPSTLRGRTSLNVKYTFNCQKSGESFQISLPLFEEEQVWMWNTLSTARSQENLFKFPFHSSRKNKFECEIHFQLPEVRRIFSNSLPLFEEEQVWMWNTLSTARSQENLFKIPFHSSRKNKFECEIHFQLPEVRRIFSNFPSTVRGRTSLNVKYTFNCQKSGRTLNVKYFNSRSQENLFKFPFHSSRKNKFECETFNCQKSGESFQNSLPLFEEEQVWMWNTLSTARSQENLFFKFPTSTLRGRTSLNVKYTFNCQKSGESFQISLPLFEEEQVWMWNTLSTARSQENLFKCPFHSSRKNKFECEIHFQLPEVRRIFSNFPSTLRGRTSLNVKYTFNCQKSGESFQNSLPLFEEEQVWMWNTFSTARSQENFFKFPFHSSRKNKFECEIHFQLPEVRRIFSKFPSTLRGRTSLNVKYTFNCQKSGESFQISLPLFEEEQVWMWNTLSTARSQENLFKIPFHSSRKNKFECEIHFQLPEVRRIFLNFPSTLRGRTSLNVKYTFNCQKSGESFQMSLPLFEEEQVWMWNTLSTARSQENLFKIPFHSSRKNKFECEIHFQLPEVRRIFSNFPSTLRGRTSLNVKYTFNCQKSGESFQNSLPLFEEEQVWMWNTLSTARSQENLFNFPFHSSRKNKFECEIHFQLPEVRRIFSNVPSTLRGRTSLNVKYTFNCQKSGESFQNSLPLFEEEQVWMWNTLSTARSQENLFKFPFHSSRKNKFECEIHFQLPEVRRIFLNFPSTLRGRTSLNVKYTFNCQKSGEFFQISLPLFEEEQVWMWNTLSTARSQENLFKIPFHSSRKNKFECEIHFQLPEVRRIFSNFPSTLRGRTSLNVKYTFQLPEVRRIFSKFPSTLRGRTSFNVKYTFNCQKSENLFKFPFHSSRKNKFECEIHFQLPEVRRIFSNFPSTLRGRTSLNVKYTFNCQKSGESFQNSLPLFEEEQVWMWNTLSTAISQENLFKFPFHSSRKNKFECEIQFQLPEVRRIFSNFPSTLRGRTSLNVKYTFNCRESGESFQISLPLFEEEQVWMWNTLSTARSQENLFKFPFHSSRKNKFECEIHFQLPEVRRIFSNFPSTLRGRTSLNVKYTFNCQKSGESFQISLPLFEEEQVWMWNTLSTARIQENLFKFPFHSSRKNKFECEIHFQLPEVRRIFSNFPSTLRGRTSLNVKYTFNCQKSGESFQISLPLFEEEQVWMWNTLSTARSQENLFKIPFHSSRKNKFECEIHFQLPEVRRIFSNFRFYQLCCVLHQFSLIITRSQIQFFPKKLRDEFHDLK